MEQAIDVFGQQLTRVVIYVTVGIVLVVVVVAGCAWECMLYMTFNQPNRSW